MITVAKAMESRARGTAGLGCPYQWVGGDQDEDGGTEDAGGPAEGEEDGIEAGYDHIVMAVACPGM
jgi:hypothetical protein